MDNRDNVTATFQELKRLTSEVNAMIEDGSFYSLPFHRRYRQIRKVKQLYSRLRGPLFDRDLVRLLSRVAPLTVLILGCNLGTSEDARGAMGLRLSLAQDIDSIERYELAITGPDMARIEQAVSGDEGIITVAVPPGTNRTIELLAIPKPADRFAIPMRGVTTISLDPDSTQQITLTMRPDPLEPAFAGAVEDPFDLPFSVGKHDTIPTLGDLDADGDLDLVTGDWDNIYSSVRSFENGGTITEPTFSYGDFGTDPGTYQSSFFAPRLIDIDDDGDLDVFVGTHGGYPFYGSTLYFENTGTPSAPQLGTFVQDPFNIGSGNNDDTLHTFGDLDGDGDLDLVLGIASASRVDYFENIGTADNPNFATAQPNPFNLTGIPPGVAPLLADLDGDGTLDILAGSSDGNLYYFENTGTPEAPDFAAAVQNPFGLTSPLPAKQIVPAVGDIDADGDLDLFVGEGEVTFNQPAGTDPSIFYFENEAR